jgi:hypothetical protein
MRLRFTIRDLLWLTALVAILAAWWLDHAKTIADKDDELKHAWDMARYHTDANTAVIERMHIQIDDLEKQLENSRATR